MKKITVTVVLYKHKKLSNGEHPLMVRLAQGGRKKYKAIGKSLPSKYWNYDKNELRKRKEFERYGVFDKAIRKAKQDYLDKIDELEIQNKEVSLDTLIKLVENPIQDCTVLNFFNEIISRLQKEGKHGNARVYSDAKNSLKDFNGGKDILFSELDPMYLKKYESWLRSKQMKDTSMSVYFRTIRSLYNKAIEEGYAREQDYPFKKFKISKFNKETSKRAISSTDIEKIRNLNLDEGTRLFNAQQYFLFGYHAKGMNFRDMATLKWSDIQENKVTYIRAKTNKEIRFTLNDRLKKILSYYRPVTGMDTNGYIFPVLDRRKHITRPQQYNRIRKVITQVNKDLKTIAKKCGIETNLSTYVWRHTMASVLKNEKGVPVEIIKELLGHDSVTTTNIYLKNFDDEIADEAMNLL